MDAARLISAARRGSGLTQTELAKRAGTSQATLSAYERGRKAPTLPVTARVVEAAGYELSLSPAVNFEQHTARGLHPFWVPDRLWRGHLPDCFATIVIDDPTRLGGKHSWDLRRRPSRKAFYQRLLRRGEPFELTRWIDGALLVDLWDDLALPHAIRAAWQPAVDLAGAGPVEHPRTALDAKRPGERPLSSRDVTSAAIREAGKAGAASWRRTAGGTTPPDRA